MLIAFAIERKETEAGKEFSRLPISEKTFERLTLRRRIDGRFMCPI